MKRFTTLLFAMVLGSSIAWAGNPNSYSQNGNDSFSIKIQPFIGSYMTPNSSMRDMGVNGPTGINFGIEFPSSQQRPWQQFLGNPTVGLGLSYIDLGHHDMGIAIAVYPYILINCVRSEHFNLKFKVGTCLAAVSETFYTTQDAPVPNRTFSTTLNAYLTPGLNAEFVINRNLTINSEFGFFHMSNGRSVEPNKGANVPYGGIGLVATFNPPAEEEKEPITFPELPYDWSVNVTVGGGIHAADEDDPHRFAVSTLHVNALYNTSNWHAIGLGADLFYNDAIGNPETNRGMYIKVEEDWKRMRGGLSIDNEFKFGVVSAIVNWGVYLFNPVRNLYNNDSPYYKIGEKRPLFYKSEETGVEEQFHYIQFGAKVRVFDNVSVQAIVKTHMHIAEFLEFGISYQIPYLNKNKRNGKKIFHYGKNWWKDYE